MRRTGIRNLSVKETRELSKLAWVRDDALSTRMSEARLLPDGRALLFMGENVGGTIFPSRQALEDVRREGQALLQKGPVDPAREFLPPIADFLRDVEAHAAALAGRLRLPAAALDRSEASLDAVDKALKRVKKAKRMTPEIITPLVAYVGMVMLGVAGGHWAKAPTTQKHRRPVYDPAEWEAWGVVQRGLWDAGAKARAHGNTVAATMSFHMSLMEAEARKPKPIGFEEIEEPVMGRENMPILLAGDGRILDPFSIVVLPMLEPSRKLPLRDAVGVALISYRNRGGSGSSG